ncbi:MAG: GntR family transcriptional regulator [Oscillospiraceae bacterium]|jgi:DNA-binding transcriptional regulator YhcF (GntR family)|nr:GntR family transcriptional regulator [Oscillospiraceae bacterium]
MDDKVYVAIARELEDDILSGVLRAGDAVPSTHQAAERFSVNPATAARGVTLLFERGLLEKRRGVGLFVTEGARDAVWERRRSEFREKAIPAVVAEAQKLGVSRQELLAMLLTGPAGRL